ncbi:MAG: hypothetical protein FJX76_18800, partial [Armatimonadetes bacterium]|nr:hypothetical protein [Armatimonadota bacterium]
MIESLYTTILAQMPTPPAQPPPVSAPASDPLDLLQDAPYSNFSPELKLTSRPLTEVLGEYASPETLFVTDAYNYPRVKYMGATEEVTSGSVQQVLKILARPGFNNFKRIVGVGGCLALD